MFRWLILLFTSLLVIWSCLALFPRISDLHREKYFVEYLCHFSLNEVVSLDLKSPQGRARFVLERNEFWRDNSGSAVPQVGEALEMFLRTRVERKISPKLTNEHGFGLDGPVLSVKIGLGKNASVWEISFGGKTPDGFGRFARVGDDREVLVLPDYQRETLSALLRE